MRQQGGRTAVNTHRDPRANTSLLVSRRAALGFLISAAGASLLAACGPQAPVQTAPPTTAPAPTKPAAAPAPTTAAVVAPTAAPAPPTAAPKPAAATPKSGGTLRWGQVGDLQTLDAVNWSPVSNNTIGQVNEMLIDYDDDLTIMPRLAESWEQSTDNRQIKLNLRKGVTWHNGREFISDDVEYSLLRARDPKNPYAAVVAPGSAWWTSWEKPDKNTIILQSDKPRPGRVRLPAVPAHPRQGHHGGPERRDDDERHRRLQVRRMGARRPLHAGQEPQLLGERPSVPGRRRRADLPRRAVDGRGARIGRTRRGRPGAHPRRGSLEERFALQAVQHPRNRPVLHVRIFSRACHPRTTSCCARRSATRSTASASSTPSSRASRPSRARCRGRSRRRPSTPRRTSPTHSTWTRRRSSSRSRG